MRIVTAKIKGFRNLREATFDLSPRVNLVLGRNGEGKTNFLEALNFFSLGRSHRGSRNEDLVAFAQDSLHVQLKVEEESDNRIVCEFGLDKSGGRRFRLDGEAVRRRADLVGRLATVFFNPDSIQLVRGAPRERRNFVDRGMSEVDSLYLEGVTAFQRVLRQKNGLLRQVKTGQVDVASASREMEAWNQELAVHAATICLGRLEYSRLLTPHAADSHRTLTDQTADLEFIYRPSLESVKKIVSANRENLPEKAQLEGDIFQEIDYIRRSEIARGRPLIGPQQDDFEVHSEGLDLRVFGSQGETRTAAVSLILARSDVLYERRQIRPVLFFDDIFSELDRERTRRLQEMASRLHQVFIATARGDDVQGWQPEGMKTWEVRSGTFTEVT